LGLLVAVSAALAAPAAAAAAGVDWPTYGFTSSRSGFNPSEKLLAPGKVGALRQLWTVKLGGVIDTQPLLATGVKLSAYDTADVVYAGTERGRFAAVDASTGRRVWTRELGAAHVSSCTDLPDYGVTGTAVLDRVRGRVYVVGGNGLAYGLDLATGRTKRHWRIATRPDREHVWGGLTLEHGILYVTTAGICDFPPYHGRVIAIDTATGQRLKTWYVTGRNGPDGGGIWGWGGVAADPLSDAIFAATGNAVKTAPSEHFGYAEHVVRLTRKLHPGINDYPGLPNDDADFGATPLLYQAGGCPPQLAVVNKYGSLYVYDRDRIGHGPVQRIKLGGSVFADNALVGVPAYWPAKRNLYVSNPRSHGRYLRGVVAFRVTSGCRLALRWQAKGYGGVSSSPTVAGGVVYFGNGVGGKVVAFDAATGHRLWTSGSTLHGKPIFAAPSVAGGRVYAGAWDSRLHAYGP
jgi:outer membrane protein assembly factor BamB